MGPIFVRRSAVTVTMSANGMNSHPTAKVARTRAAATIIRRSANSERNQARTTAVKGIGVRVLVVTPPSG